MDDRSDPNYYLADGFDPASLTVPHLRNLLLTHEVDYPSNAKKPQLIQLFRDEITPQARKLLSSSQRVKRSARGIVDVPSSNASTVDEDEISEPEPPPPPPPPARRTGRRKTKTEEESDATLLAPDTGRARRTTSRHAKSMDPEPVPVPEPEPELPVKEPRRRGRPSKTPKVEEQDPATRRTHAEDSPFTTDNPFQSGGSSPPAEARRRTADSSTIKKEKPRTSISRRRKTDGQGSAYEMPVAAVNRRPSPLPQQEIVPAGEEFAPEEAIELAIQEKSGEVVRPPRRKATSSSSLLLRGVLWPIFVLGIVTTGFWMQEKFNVGYCGIGNAPRIEFRGVEIPEWAEAVRPTCEPCPQHALCYQNLETTCEEDFVLKHHPMTLNGLLPLPLPPTCEPDSEKARRVQNVVDRAIDTLRERNAKFECDENLPGESKPPPSAGLAEEELRVALSAKKTKRMTQEEFDALWKEAIPEIHKRDEVVSESASGTRSIRSLSRSHQSITCAIKTSLRAWLADLGRSLRHKLAEYFWALVLMSLLGGSGTYGYRQIGWKRTEEEWAKELARQSFDHLSTHATLHAEDPNAYPEPFLLVSHLRDQILHEDINKRWVQNLWAKAAYKVKMNSNVRQADQETRRGDYGQTWEWVGPAGATPDGTGRISGASRRKSRQSFMPIASSPLSGLSTLPPQEYEDRKPDMSERKWQESRPIY